MKIINVILYFILSSSFLISLKAQTDTNGKRKLCNEYAKEFNYKYIFQGKIISSKIIRVKEDKGIYYDYNSYLVQVQKVLKGNIEKPTTEILKFINIEPNKENDIGQMISSDGDIGGDNPPSEGVYFSNKGINVKDSSATNTNLKSFLYYDGIPLSNGKLVKGKKGISLYFSTLSNFYEYLRANYGVKIEQ